MKSSDEKLQSFGMYVTELCSQMHVTYGEVCAETGISRTTFSEVWKGETVNITHYLRIVRYLWQEADERQRRRIDTELLDLFHP